MCSYKIRMSKIKGINLKPNLQFIAKWELNVASKPMDANIWIKFHEQIPIYQYRKEKEKGQESRCIDTGKFHVACMVKKTRRIDDNLWTEFLDMIYMFTEKNNSHIFIDECEFQYLWWNKISNFKSTWCSYIKKEKWNHILKTMLQFN